MPTTPFDPSHESNRPGYLRRASGSMAAGHPPVPVRGNASARPVRPVPPTEPRAVDSITAPQRGDWLFTCRPGAEDDVEDELRAIRMSPVVLQAGLVMAKGITEKGKRVPPTALHGLIFARQAVPVQRLSELRGLDPAAAAKHIVDGICRDLKDRPLAVQVFAADSESGKQLAGRCSALHAALMHELAAGGFSVAANGPAAHSEGGQLLMVCLLSFDQAVVGALLSSAALSLHPGGILRVRRSHDAPSRSASKLSEALAWLGHGPQGGESCVDLGAAPGGWSQVLAERGCSVIAVDTGRLAAGLSRRIQHVRQNAFDYAPDESVDWLCCDMAYRPLEVAGLLARWGRRRWARFLVANIKLPMKQRVAMLGRVREILESGGWTGLRARQLYHDRDEVTLFAWRGFGLDTRVQHQSPRIKTETAVPFRAPKRGTAREGRPAAAKPALGARPGKASSARGKPARSSQAGQARGKPARSSQAGTARGKPAGSARGSSRPPRRGR
ncbi:MAG: 23S rRNA (cytidine(2498)-2'-O)-methyltransferase RlmM [Myxococcales bacterium]|nr:23S rRNA (cytidine(2498)-2'-O)-methyltransferase RlmM [Myxococcales bacterium]